MSLFESNFSPPKNTGVYRDDPHFAVQATAGMLAATGRWTIASVQELVRFFSLAVAVLWQSCRPLTWRRTVWAEFLYQCHHLVRTVPGEGLIVTNNDEPNLQAVLEKGCWTPTETFSENNGKWTEINCSDDGKKFTVCVDGEVAGEVSWDMHGKHNRMNALAAIAAARHAGVPVKQACAAMTEFKGIKRRLEVKGEVNGITVYDDFAHHPTAIEETIDAMKEVSKDGVVFAVLEPRSNTMRMGIHKDDMMRSLKGADEVLLYQPAGLDWDLTSTVESSDVKAKVYEDVNVMIKALCENARSGDHVLIMSNGGFESIHDRLLSALNER